MEVTRTKPFPKGEEDFKNDDRICFDTADNLYVLEDEDGKQYEWLSAHSAWVEKVDEELIRAHQAAYGAKPEDDQPADIDNKKRKADEKSAPEKKKPKKAPKERPNSSIYVTGIPTDATFDDLVQCFKKCGLIANNIDSQQPRVIMYTNSDGTFKGEALITYFRIESVNQAINLLDGADFRTGMSGSMRVRQADPDRKRVPLRNSGDTNRAPTSNLYRERTKRMTIQMNQKLADWDDDDPRTEEIEAMPTDRYGKTVIVKHMFTLQGLEKEPDLLNELPEDIRDQAREEEWGQILQIEIYDKEPEGVVRIKFADPEGAKKAVMKMDGRFFAGKQLVAYVPEKKEYYKKKPRDAEEEEDRLKKYGEELSKAGE